MRYYLVAGEASGDLHGSNLMKALKVIDPDAEFRFWGGDLMAQVGGTLVSHYKDRAFMGLTEVLFNIRKIAKFLSQCKRDLEDWQPDALILIDNPGFNLRIAEFAKKLGITVHYYIAPKVWAWNTGRVRNLQRDVHFLYSILPFEKEFFASYGVQVNYVGNPVVDAIHDFTVNPDFRKNNQLQKPIIALLPGSRKQEVYSLLADMLTLPSAFPEFDFVVASAPSWTKSDFARFNFGNNVKLVFGQTYDLLSEAHAAIVASGTASLETAIFHVPQIVVYKVSPVTYFVGKRLIKVKFISLVNLILNKPAVPELIQGDCNPDRLKLELKKIIDGSTRDEMLMNYRNLAESLGSEGASIRAAGLIFTRTKSHD